MRRCGGSPPTAKLPHFSEEVPAGNKSPNKKSRWRQLSTSSARNSRPWHALQNPEPTGKRKGKGNPTKTTANHPNPELPRTQKLEPRRLRQIVSWVAFRRYTTIPNEERSGLFCSCDFAGDIMKPFAGCVSFEDGAFRALIVTKYHHMFGHKPLMPQAYKAASTASSS